MKLKKFASFLVTGKILASTTVISAADKNLSADYSKASSFANSLNLTADQILNPNLSLIEVPSGESVVLNQINLSNNDTYGGAGEVAATIYLPGEGCTFYAQQSLTVVVTGVKPGDEVYVAVSKEIDNSYWDTLTGGKTAGKLKLGKDLNLVAYFKVTGQGFSQQQTLPGLSNVITGDMTKTFMPINLSITIPDIYNMADSYLYLQAIVFPDGKLDWNYAKASEVDKIYITEKNCSSDNYGSQY